MGDKCHGKLLGIQLIATTSKEDVLSNTFITVLCGCYLIKVKALRGSDWCCILKVHNTLGYQNDQLCMGVSQEVVHA